MAKNDNLTDFLTDVADAIRSKKGTSAKINPQNFANEIASIETGGSGGGNALPTAGVNDVTFYDYNGHILYSYSRSEFLALTEMPAAPSRDGLSFIEWSHDLDEAQEYVSLYRRLNIGACYTTANGRTQTYFDIYSDDNLQRKILLNINTAGGLKVHYGGKVSSNSGTGNRSWTMTYDKKGSYVNELEVIGNAKLGIGSTASSNKPFFGNAERTSINASFPTGAGLRKIHCGDGISSYNPFCFTKAIELEEISLSPANDIGQSALAGSGIKCCVIPRGINSVGANVCSSCYQLKVAILPNTINSLGSAMFSNCYCLQSINVPTGVTTIPSEWCSTAKNLEVVTIPKTVQSIGQKAFYNCAGLRLIDMTQHEQVPTLGSDAFYNASNLKIIVPDALFAELVADAGWSAYSSKIIRESEYYGSAVFIQHIDGNLYTIDEWSAGGYSNESANGVAVISQDASFVISKVLTGGSMVWSSDSVNLVEGVMTTSDEATARTDYNGKRNTELIAVTDISGAAYSCAKYEFPNGNKGYLPALAEWAVAFRFKKYITTAMALIGGREMVESDAHWSSTQSSSSGAWGHNWSNGSAAGVYMKYNGLIVRAFTTV